MLHDPVLFSNPSSLTSDAPAEIVAEGTVPLHTLAGGPCILRNVKCVPSAASNLISVSAFVNQGGRVETNPKGDSLALIGLGNFMCQVQQSGGLYVLKGAWVLGSKHADLANVAQVVRDGNPDKHSHSCVLRS
jgi:GAG-pre-integrase domain